MSYFFFSTAVLIAILDWFAVAKKWRKVEYIAKPGVMVALLAWFLEIGAFHGPLIWFAIGLAFSMAGDIFLKLPREQFIAGLIAFLLAHIAYLAGLNQSPPPINLASLALALVVLVTAVLVYRRISAGLETSGQSELKLPVLVYSAVIGLMLFSALLTLVRTDWDPGPALLISAGALLFFLSDTFLAWNKFVAPLRHGKLIVIVPYHLGQMLIALGAVSHYLG